MRNISNRALAPHQPLRAGILKMLVQHAVQAPRLVLVPRDPVRDLLRGVAGEVVGLALHGAYAGVHEEEPVRHLFCSSQ